MSKPNLRLPGMSGPTSRSTSGAPALQVSQEVPETTRSVRDSEC
jgi:hypothetical protein